MKISAKVQNRAGKHDVTLRTDDNLHSLAIPPKPTGFGSSANGGELLFLALATCYCNDIYREAAKRGLTVEQVEVEVAGEFGAEGEPARNVSYRAKVTAQASEAQIRELMRYTDQVAEIQNTLRRETRVILSDIEAVAVNKSVAQPQARVIKTDMQGQDYVRLLGGPPETCSLRSGAVALQPGKTVGKHSTGDHEELIIVLEGEGALLLNEGRELSFKVGTVAYCPPNTEHDVKNTGTTALRYIYVVAKTQ